MSIDDLRDLYESTHAGCTRDSEGRYRGRWVEENWGAWLGAARALASIGELCFVEEQSE